MTLLNCDECLAALNKIMKEQLETIADLRNQIATLKKDTHESAIECEFFLHDLYGDLDDVEMDSSLEQLTIRIKHIIKTTVNNLE